MFHIRDNEKIVERVEHINAYIYIRMFMTYIYLHIHTYVYIKATVSMRVLPPEVPLCHIAAGTVKKKKKGRKKSRDTLPTLLTWSITTSY